MTINRFLMAVTLGLAFALPASAVTVAGSHAQLPCQICHTQSTSVPPTKATCLSCHQSYQALAERTKGLTPNPHFSHRGERDCTACHSMHGKPHFECNDCHTFNLKMKGE